MHLYIESPKAAHRLILNAVGHGVAADDDKEDALFFEKCGIPERQRRPVKTFESPWDSAFQYIEAAVEKLA